MAYGQKMLIYLAEYSHGDCSILLTSLLNGLYVELSKHLLLANQWPLSELRPAKILLVLVLALVHM